MLIKQRVCSYYFGRKVMFRGVDPCGVCGERVGCNSVILSSLRNVRSVFIVVILMCLGG